MTIAFVRQATGTANVATTAVVTITAATSGNCLVACIEGNNFPVTGVASTGATWKLLCQGTAAHNYCEIWYALNVTGSGTTVTVTFSSAVTGAVNVSEWSGIKAAVADDNQENTSNGVSTAATSGAVTPTAAPALVIASMATTTGITAGPSGGFTALTEAIQGSNRSNGAYLIQTSPASATCGWTITSGNWDTAIGVLLGHVGSVETLLAATNSGMLQSDSTVYLTARSGNTPTATSGDQYGSFGQKLVTTFYTCYELLAEFDLSSIPAGSTINSAIFSMWIVDDQSVDAAGFTAQIRAYDYGASIASGDWIAGASLSAQTLLADMAISTPIVGAYTAFTDVAAIAAVTAAIGSTLRIVGSSDRTAAGTTPTVREHVDPYLVDAKGLQLIVDWTLSLTQVRPDADITTTGWTTTPLWSKIEEVSADGTVITATAS